jgi:predicted DNA-binding transcriptional regulator YafY
MRIVKKFIDAISLLSRPGGATIDELASRLEIGKRQAYRVIEKLQDDFCFVINRDQPMLGGEFRFSLESGQWKRLSDMRVPDLNLSIEEIIALYFLKGHAKLYKGTGIDADIDRAFAKLGAFVPERFSTSMERVRTIFCSAPHFAKDYTGKHDLIEDLKEAILQQQTCLVEYHSFTDDTVKRFKIDPLRFFEKDGGLYIFVRATKFGDIITLAVERIKSLEITETGFSYPSDFDPEALLETAFGLYYDDPVTVKVGFPKSQARYIKERRWAKRQKITEAPDGSITLKMTTSGWYDVKRWVLSFGPDAELLKPADRRKEILDTALELAKMYGGQTPASPSVE